MQDIRKPYSRSKSNLKSNVKTNKVLDAKVEAFETRKYDHVLDDDSENTPRRASQRSFSPKDISSDSDIYPRKNIRTPAKKGSSKEMWILSAFFTAVIVFVVLYTYVFNSAVITLTPKYSDIAVSKSVMFGGDASGVSFVIATSSIEKSKTIEQSETKKVQTKAQGTITIYNDLDSEPQRLLKNTRFEAQNGKVFRITNSIIVPGKKGDVAGSIDAVVFADSYGEDYNMTSAEFTIPGFKGTPRYKGFYARSKGVIAGGANGDKKLVSLSDLTSVKDELALSLKSELTTQLKTMKKEGYIALPQAIRVVFTDNEGDLLIGNTNIYKVTATGYLVFAREEDIAKTIAKISPQYNNEPVRLDHQEKLTFTVKEDTDIASSTPFSVTLEGTPRVVWKVDEVALTKALLGTSKEDFGTVLRGFPSVQKSEMKLSPVWASSFPSTANKIQISEKLPTLSK